MKWSFLAISVIVLITCTTVSLAIELEQQKSSEPGTSQYQAHDRILIRHDVDFEDLGVPGSGTDADPYVIEGLNITDSSQCVYIDDISASFIIRDCYFRTKSSSHTICVWIEDAKNATIEDCIIRGGEGGIWTQHCEFVTLRNLTIIDSLSGVDLSNCMNFNLTGCRIYNTAIGMNIRSARNSSFIENKIYMNDVWGIDVEQYSLYNEFIGNMIGFNGEGFEVGIGGNAADDGENNTWNGNAWDDYSGSGDYMLRGSENTFDFNPILLEDSSDPLGGATVHNVEDEPSTKNVNWYISDEFPLSYEIYLHNSIIKQDTWWTNDISFTLSELTVGNHNMTMVARDAAGNIYEETVTITVFGQTMTNYVLIGLGVGIVVIVLVLFDKMVLKNKNHS